MGKRDAVIYGLAGQVLEHYPLEALAPSSATASIWQGGRGEDEDAELTPAVTIDDLSEAVTAASGYSQAARRRLHVDAADIELGVFYRLENTEGLYEIVRFASKADDDTYADAEHELAYDYAVGSTLVGLRMTIPVDNTWAADEGNLNAESLPYRVRWSYTAGGLARRAISYFDLVRAPSADSVQDDDLFNHWPDLAYLVPPGDRRRLLAEARERFDFDLRTRQLDPANIADVSLRNQLIKRAVKMVAIESGKAVPQGQDPATALRTATRAYLDGVEMAAHHLKHAQNRGDGNFNPGHEPPLMCRS